MAALIESLTTALYSKLTTSNPFATAMGGRIYFEQYKSTDGSLPQTFPFAVFFYVSGVPAYTFTSSKEDILIQISIFDSASSAANMLSHISKLHTLMDFAALSPTGWTVVDCRRESTDLLVPDETNSIRHAAITYRIYAQKV